MTEAGLFWSTDIPATIMLRVQPFWHFLPADAPVNVKDRATFHFTFECAPTGVKDSG
jgi:hypothetical protein